MILFVDLARSFGGAEIRVLNTVREMAGQRTCGAVVLNGSRLHQLLIKEDISVYPLPYRRGSLRNAWAMRRIIKKNGVLLVDTQNVQSHFWGMVGAFFSKQTRTVITVHSVRDVTFPFMKNLLHEMVLRISNWTGCHFVAVSDSVRNYLNSLGIAEKRISLISNGLPIERMVKAAVAAVGFRESTGWDDSNFLVLVVGRLEAIKGHRFLLEALPEVIDTHPHVRCCVVGRGRCEKELRDLVERMQLHHHVHFAGFRTDVERILPESDMICMPSLSEGLPYTLLEACVFKVPIVASRVGGIPEFLEDGDSALLVEPADSSQIAGAIRLLADNRDLAAKLSRRAFEVVRKQHDLSATINKTLGLYDTMISGKK